MATQLERAILRSYLIVGQSGAGKSSFINAVFGREVATSNPFEAETKVVERFTYITPAGVVELIDTPSLGEDTPDLDRTYLSLVSEAIAHQPIDILIYVTRLDDTCFRPAEKMVLQLITQQLSPCIWHKSWLVLTHAARVPLERFDETIKARFVEICLFLQEATRSLDMKNSQFKHFKDVMVIDNITPGWHNNAVPITSIFVHQ